MKSKMIRVLAIALLTTSMSAFALPGKSKAANETKTSNPDETVVIYVDDKPTPDEEQVQPDERQKKSDEQQKIEKQDKEWLHDLANIVAG